MIECASVTDQGRRDCNEDAIGVFSHGAIHGFVVCDGLGGHGLGEVASSITVDLFRKAVQACNVIDKAFFHRFFEEAQNKLLSEQKKNHVPNKMKTTAAALVIDDDHAYIGHIGDSRVYVFNQSSMAFRTLDHSVPEALRRAGMISESEIRHHSDRNKLLKVLGSSDTGAEGTVSEPFDLEGVKAFLPCTDGFWEYIDEEKMCECLNNSCSPKDWLEQMTAEVHKNGMNENMDNYSAIAVWIQK